MDDIRIFVFDLAAYNNGKIHGVWIDATLEPDEIEAHIKAMLELTPEPHALEYTIHAYEGFYGYQLSELSDIETVHAIACFLQKHKALGARLLEYNCGDIDSTKPSFEDCYCGQFDSVGTFAEALTTDTTEIPSCLEHYIDYERMGRDMEASGDIVMIEINYNEIHVFWKR